MATARRKPLIQRVQTGIALLVDMGQLALVIVLIGAAWRLYTIFGPTQPVP